jgi:hypothetical protein
VCLMPLPAANPRVLMVHVDPPLAAPLPVCPVPPPAVGNRIVLSLCDGMGCCAMALQDVRADITRYIGVELDPTAKLIAHNTNPETCEFLGVDHSWHSDVTSISELDIAALG